MYLSKYGNDVSIHHLEIDNSFSFFFSKKTNENITNNTYRLGFSLKPTKKKNSSFKFQVLYITYQVNSL